MLTIISTACCTLMIKSSRRAHIKEEWLMNCQCWFLFYTRKKGSFNFDLKYNMWFSYNSRKNPVHLYFIWLSILKKWWLEIGLLNLYVRNVWFLINSHYLLFKKNVLLLTSIQESTTWNTFWKITHLWSITMFVYWCYNKRM